MRTRTRILICVGLLAAAVGVVLVRTFPARPRVDIGFARYTDDGVAVLLKKFNQSTTQRWEKPVLALQPSMHPHPYTAQSPAPTQPAHRSNHPLRYDCEFLGEPNVKETPVNIGDGARCRVRTCDPFRVKEMLYR